MLFVSLVAALSVACVVYWSTTKSPYLDTWNTPHRLPDYYGRIAIVSKWVAIVLSVALVIYSAAFFAFRLNLP